MLLLLLQKNFHAMLLLKYKLRIYFYLSAIISTLLNTAYNNLLMQASIHIIHLYISTCIFSFNI